MRKLIPLVLVLPLLFSACAQRETVSGASAAGEKKLPAASPAVSPAALPAPGARLSDAGFRCEVALLSPPEEFRLGGAQMTLRVKLTKRTSEPWPVQTPGTSPINAVNLAYHWLDEKTGVPIKEGGRVPLAANLAEGAAVELDLPVASPGAAGSFVLKVEPVQEGVAWFSEKSTCFQTAHVKAKL